MFKALRRRRAIRWGEYGPPGLRVRDVLRPRRVRCVPCGARRGRDYDAMRTVACDGLFEAGSAFDGGMVVDCINHAHVEHHVHPGQVDLLDHSSPSHDHHHHGLHQQQLR